MITSLMTVKCELFVNSNMLCFSCVMIIFAIEFCNYLQTIKFQQQIQSFSQ